MIEILPEGDALEGKTDNLLGMILQNEYVPRKGWRDYDVEMQKLVVARNTGVVDSCKAIACCSIDKDELFKYIEQKIKELNEE